MNIEDHDVTEFEDDEDWSWIDMDDGEYFEESEDEEIC